VTGKEPPNKHVVRASVLDERQIADEIERHLGKRPLELVQRPTKLPRFVYEARFAGGGRLIFKAEHDTGGDDAIVLECWAMEQAAGVGVSAPAVLALDASRTTFPARYAIFSFVDGLPLAELALPNEDAWKALRGAGELLRRLHSVRVDGYGRLDDELYLATGAVRGRDDEWVAGAARGALSVIAERRLLAPAETDALATFIDEHRVALEQYAEPRLLHGDFDEQHIFVDPESMSITAIIDFGDREAGDPLWDLSWFGMGRGSDRVRTLLAGYAPDIDDEHVGRMLAIYAVVRLLIRTHRRIVERRESELGWFIERLRFVGRERLLPEPSWAAIERLFGT
jgi:aminoglycoside phosphotransferase (APT) family kinase protein